MKNYLFLVIFPIAYCQGLLAQENQKVHETVQSFLSIANQAHSCTPYKLDGWEYDNSPDGFKGFKVEMKRFILSKSEQKQLLSLLNKTQLYNTSLMKLCDFTPDYAFSFAHNNQTVEVLMSQSCKTWRFFVGKEKVTAICDSLNTPFFHFAAKLFLETNISEAETGKEMEIMPIKSKTLLLAPKNSLLKKIRKEEIIRLLGQQTVEKMEGNAEVLAENITLSRGMSREKEIQQEDKELLEYIPTKPETWATVAKEFGTTIKILKEGNCIENISPFVEPNAPIIIYKEKAETNLMPKEDLDKLVSRLHTTKSRLAKWNKVKSENDILGLQKIIYFE